jgi:hypothetical protein
VKQWNNGEKVIQNKNTNPGTVVKQEGKRVTVLLDSGHVEVFGANDLKRRR